MYTSDESDVEVQRERDHGSSEDEESVKVDGPSQPPASTLPVVVVPDARPVAVVKPTGGFGAGRKGRVPPSQKVPMSDNFLHTTHHAVHEAELKPIVCSASTSQLHHVGNGETHDQVKSEEQVVVKSEPTFPDQSMLVVKKEEDSENMETVHIQVVKTTGIPTRQLTLEEMGVLAMVMSRE